MTRLFREGSLALPELLALYDERVRFEDPLHTVTGREALGTHNERFARRMLRVEMSFGDAIEDDRAAYAAWTARVTPRLGPEAVVDGVTRLVLEDGKITAQRDYFDVSQAVPVLGAIVRVVARLLYVG